MLHAKMLVRFSLDSQFTFHVLLSLETLATQRTFLDSFDSHRIAGGSAAKL